VVLSRPHPTPAELGDSPQVQCALHRQPGQLPPPAIAAHAAGMPRVHYPAHLELGKVPAAPLDLTTPPIDMAVKGNYYAPGQPALLGGG